MIVTAVRRAIDEIATKPSTGELIEAALVVLDRINTADLREHIRGVEPLAGIAAMRVIAIESALLGAITTIRAVSR